MRIHVAGAIRLAIMTAATAAQDSLPPLHDGKAPTNIARFYAATIDERATIPSITCPILFMSSTNDFAGPFGNMTEN